MTPPPHPKMTAETSVKPSEQELIVPLPRMTLNPPLAVQQVGTKQGPGKFFGYAVNISREGIFVPTVNPRPVGFKARVRLELPKGRGVVEGEIEVVWNREFDPKHRERPAGMGLRFKDLSEETKRRIDTFLGA